MKKILIYILLFIFLIPIKVGAISNDYQDLLFNIVGEKKEEGKINIYLFYSDVCPHCHNEIDYLNSVISVKYKDKVNIYKYEVTNNKDNNKIMQSVKAMFNFNGAGVPFTVIGKDYIYGYGEVSNKNIESVINKYLNDTKKDKKINLPVLGEVQAKDTSLTLSAIILGFIDGFNPCAMWILLLLINMCINIKNRKKMLIIGLTFILTSGFIYLLSMLGIGLVLDITTISILRSIIGFVAILLGIYNLYVWYKTRKDTGCHVVNKEKRKNIITKINNILSNKNFVFALLGTIALAISVNLVELACSLGFPTIFLELLSINKVTGIYKIIMILIYIFFYLIDDLAVFLIALFTLKTTGISTKYNKYVNLIGGVLMFIMGILLIFKPEWIMFNF